MSNHIGGYMLDNVLQMLDEEYKFFEDKSIEEIVKIANDFSSIGCRYDCNDGEILEYISNKYNICYCCISHSGDLEDGVCVTCRNGY